MTERREMSDGATRNRTTETETVMWWKQETAWQFGRGRDEQRVAPSNESTSQQTVYRWRKAIWLTHGLMGTDNVSDAATDHQNLPSSFIA